ncbi:MAG: zinc ribbon domain-containing protein [Methylobacter sp.]
MLENQTSLTFSWGKPVQYLIAIIITLMIGEIVETIPLFSTTEVFRGLTSSELVSFSTNIAVLVLFFLFTKHAINALVGSGDAVIFLRRLAIPVAVLIIVCIAQQSIGAIITPYLGSTGKTVLILISSLAVLSAALWVIIAGYRYSPMLFDFFAALVEKIRSLIPGNAVERKCPACAVPVKGAEKYCLACGNDLELKRCKNCDAEMAESAKYCGQCGHPRQES